MHRTMSHRRLTRIEMYRIFVIFAAVTDNMNVHVAATKKKKNNCQSLFTQINATLRYSVFFFQLLLDFLHHWLDVVV